MNTIYNLLPEGEQFKGKVLLVVNIASNCGYTHQLEQLQKLYEKYKADGFEIIAFPSNDFAGQEPLDSEGARLFCNVNFETTFQVMNKIHVKGSQKHPLYKFLSNKSENGYTSVPPLWNFHKYLIDREGHLRDYFLTITNPMSAKVTRKIESLLHE